jgi:Mg2+/Co2+ transporter CorC
MPRRGEAVSIGGLELKVQRADRRRIETLRVTTPGEIQLKSPGTG